MSEEHVGTRFREARETAGLSRTDIMRMSGLSVPRVARIELKGTGTDEELDAYRDALKGVLGDVLASSDPDADLRSGGGDAHPASRNAQSHVKIETGSPTLSGVGSDGSVRVVDWNGLHAGDVVRVRGEDGRFRFHYFHKDDHQEYVALSGPIVNWNGRTLGRQQRCIRPDRIIIPTTRGRR